MERYLGRGQWLLADVPYGPRLKVSRKAPAFQHSLLCVDRMLHVVVFLSLGPFKPHCRESAQGGKSLSPNHGQGSGNESQELCIPLGSEAHGPSLHFSVLLSVLPCSLASRVVLAVSWLLVPKMMAASW